MLASRHSSGLALVGWMPALFLIFTFLLGGGSRSDIASLPILRAVSVLVAFWAMSQMQKEDWARISAPLALLLALTAWIALQLVPLPPSLWQSFSGRETVAAIDGLLGQSDIWRPISLTPSLTLNSLLAMSVPIAALLLAARVMPEDHSRLMLVIMYIAGFSALLGLVQVITGPSSPAYLYRITNSDSMVGLFANRNHHAVFLACCIPVAAMLLRDELMRKRRRGFAMGGLAIIMILLTVMTVLIGSRAGFVMGVLGFTAGYVMVLSAWGISGAGNRSSGSRPAASPARQWLRYSPPLVLMALLGAAVWSSSRATGFSRVVGQDVAADLRVQAWPTVRSMVETYWGVGSGFGSFPKVYMSFEPDRLLQLTYFNRAHNDWAEIVMTGGLPALLILLVALLWIGLGVRAQGLRNLVKGYRGDIRLPVLIVVLFLGAASVVDYPLRLPSIQAFVVMMIVLLCCPAPRRMAGD
ncbi:O-antigen ligase family protein [Sphingopyxis panaciterrae]